MINIDDLMDKEGENQAVRAFLMYYGGGNATCPLVSMRAHLARSGFDGCWPEWAAAPNSTTLTKAGAQLWIRHLFSLESSLARTASTDAATRSREDGGNTCNESGKAELMAQLAGPAAIAETFPAWKQTVWAKESAEVDVEAELHKAIATPTPYEAAAFRKGFRAARTQADAGKEREPRVYMDHGMWHDRQTGQHLFTQDEYDQHGRDRYENGRQEQRLETKRLATTKPENT